MSFLLIGGESEIAGATLAALRRDGLPAIATTRRRDRVGVDCTFLDLAARLDDWQPPDGVEAACIFAAIGHLAECARDPAGSALVNVAGTIALAERLAERGVYVLYLSTDKVFDGSRAQMPADAPLCPVSEYGRQKAQTDAHLQMMIAAGAPVGILRLAKIVSPGIALFGQWQAALAAGTPIQAFHDMMMAPTPVADAAAAIIALLGARASGVWQLSGAEDISYAETAIRIARRVGADAALVQPVAAATAGMPAGATPRHTTLDSGALIDRFAISPREPWPVIAASLDPLASAALGD
jgi:dTDP-4-dehydrorhamnose reductase